MPLPTFADLVRLRRFLQQEFAAVHFESLTRFQCESKHKFRLFHGDGSPRKGTTTSATCIESLLCCPKRFRPTDAADLGELAQLFAEEAIGLPPGEWKSDESARLYCRCRALPLVIQFLSDFDTRIDTHIGFILRQLKKDTSRFAIGEARGLSARPSKWFPANAFHTYWFMELLRRYEFCFPEKYGQLSKKNKLKRLQQQMLLWSERQLGIQIALHTAESSTLDSDQLAWALAIKVHFGETPRRLDQHDLLRITLQCLFSTQEAVGTWRQYKPLFHYQQSGNAYCYVFETFHVLLRAALRTDRAVLREALLQHAAQLGKLFEYAYATRIPLTTCERPRAEHFGWSSGHRTSDQGPEGWATASVFACAQAFRRLLGIWTREQAMQLLRRSRPPRTRTTPEVAERTLVERGRSWTFGSEPGAGDQLSDLFVERIKPRQPNHACPAEEDDPDEQVIARDQARSAILYGPPGTGKTTLCAAVAGAIGWEFIEIHASDFVAEGLPNVQRTADRIFSYITELDRCVVLFDEIDELVRTRDEHTDAFGRFLTTSMLPKLAELWTLRKLLFFVATNHIEYFDAAIMRSERFDVLLFVAPMDYAEKVSALAKAMGRQNLQLEPTKEQCNEAVQKAAERANKSAEDASERVPTGRNLNENEILARFVLLRYDQLFELAHHLAACEGVEISDGAFREALSKIEGRRFAEIDECRRLLEGADTSRRDYRMKGAAALPNEGAGSAGA